MRIEDARQEAFRSDLKQIQQNIEVNEAMASQGNDLGRLNDALFAELENLRKVKVSDPDALKAEVERSRAVEGIAKVVISNAGTVLEATRMRAQLASGEITMPKMLGDQS